MAARVGKPAAAHSSALAWFCLQHVWLFTGAARIVLRVEKTLQTFVFGTALPE